MPRWTLRSQSDMQEYLPASGAILFGQFVFSTALILGQGQKPVIPDYDWIIFGVKVTIKTLLTSRCINQRGAGHSYKQRFQFSILTVCKFSIKPQTFIERWPEVFFSGHLLHYCFFFLVMNALPIIAAKAMQDSRPFLSASLIR